MIYIRPGLRPKIPLLNIFPSTLPGHGVDDSPARANARFTDPINIQPDFTSDADGVSTDIISVIDFTDHPPAAAKALAPEKKVTHYHRSIEKFNPDCSPAPDKQYSYGGNLVLLSFRPSKSVWAGEQRQWAHFNIPDATSRADHIRKAMVEHSHLSGDIPIPGGN